MIYENYFKHLFKSVPDYRKIVLLIFLIRNEKDFFEEMWTFKKKILFV